MNSASQHFSSSFVSFFSFLGLSFLLCSVRSWTLSQIPPSCHSKASRASLLADSTNVAFTISMLLGNLSSCCNPWIYMGFNSYLWPLTKVLDHTKASHQHPQAGISLRFVKEIL